MIDLKQYAEKKVVVQLKASEQWLAWQAPARSEQNPYPTPLVFQAPDGQPKPVALPFLEGTATADGELLVETPNKGAVLVALDPATIASVTRVHAFAEESRGASNLIVPGN